ncbi:MAG: N-acetylneuraminate synthase family protein [Bacteroidetes bacterium]|nr:N-acetylneuraminate synthase family protein [Bacteroidota bacterium]
MTYTKILDEFGFKSKNNVYIIAEIGLNHGGDLELAKKLIDSAAKTGTDAVKFQTYLTEKRTAADSPIFNVLKKCELPFEAFKQLKEYSDKNNVEFFSTPFDEESAAYLNSIDVELYKISSFDVVNHNFLRKIASYGKPVIMSVGMSNTKEIETAFKILSKGTKKIALLHCISAYPTQEEDAMLSNIYELKKKFDCPIGQSDHTYDITVPLYAIAAGAQLIEKHYKIDDGMDCVDAPVSITEKQLTRLVKETRRLEKIIGKPKFGIRESEKEIEQFRRYSK